jgi:transposase, IS30 family
VLREKVEQDLEKKYSPEQITGRLRREFPDDPEMWVSLDTIYQSIYVRSGGALRRDLAVCLRTGRGTVRAAESQGRSTQEPHPEHDQYRGASTRVEDRAVPGSWGGDLIIGKRNQTAIGTLVERQTGYTMLLHLPDGVQARAGPRRSRREIKTLPDSLRLSLTWDQGPEMREWKHVSIDAGIDIYFCDPHSPWQRGMNEHTNGLLRHYFPKGPDLSVHSAEDLDWVAQELNDRPRKRLAFKKPIELIGDLLSR